MIRHTDLSATLSIFVVVLMTVLNVANGSESDGAYYEVESLNPSLSVAPPDLETPLAAVEAFVLASRQESWAQAAAVMDFRLLEPIDEARAIELGKRFFFVLNQELWIDWGRLPDRPDGMSTGSVLGSQSPMIGEPRKTITLGSIDVGDRSIPINIDRLKAASGTPVWMFSAHTVDNVPLLWEAHGPSWLAQQMPSWARDRAALRIQVWQWIALAASLVLCPLVGFVVGVRLFRASVRVLPVATTHFARMVKFPIAITLSTLLFWIVQQWLLGLPGSVASVLEPVSLVLLVSSGVWLAMRSTTYVIDSIVKRAIRDYHEEESTERRRFLTQITVGRHVLLLILAALGLAVVFIQLDAFRIVGITMISSAGAAAVILGIAGRAVLGNLISGLQIALVQPFRIGDTVYVEENWGRIEEITYVDVVVKTWDHRRLVFPIGYFVSGWFENWSKTDSYLIKAIYLQLDYTACVDTIRAKFLELIQSNEHFDAGGADPEVLVTDLGNETMTVRLTAGGKDPGDAWLLACRTREQLISWLQDDHPGWLPKRRIQLDSYREEVAA